MERADWLYETWMEKVGKFDYFVAGADLALLGYLAPRLQLVRGSVGGKPIVELLALAVILGSAVCALKRIEATNVLASLNHQRISRLESAGALMEVFGTGRPALNKRTGEIIDPLVAGQQVGQEQKLAGAAELKFDHWSSGARSWYQWRDRLLIFGLALILVSRVAGLVWG